MYGQIIKEQPFDFTKHSTIGCGGVARQAFYPKNEEETGFLLDKQPNGWIVVGNMSNVLPPDAGTDKTVICTKKLTEIRVQEDTVYVSAGVTSGNLLRFMQGQGYSGTEFLAGIPCTMGGILYMNGGAGGRYIDEFVDGLRIVRNGRIIDLPVSECGYSYKNSVFMQTDDFILGGYLRLVKAKKEDIAKSIKSWLDRRVHLPKGKSMGCVFKNPKGFSAGALIERTGLKGLRIGGAKVSEEHANFIINDKNATAREITSLITMIKNAVYAQYGILLEEEIRYLK